MLEKPKIVQTEALTTAVIRLRIPRTEIQNVMGPGITELLGALADQDVLPAGAIYSHHFRMDPATFDFEIGVPVKSPVAAVGRVQPGTLPAAKVARTVYQGPYEGLASAWGEFNAWITSQGLAAAQNLWECYVRGPESGPDPAQWRTELNRPLLR